jgi:WD40 repeat protein
MKRRLHVNAGVMLTVAWSPDGRSIAAGSSSHSVTIWDAATGICKRHLSISGELDTVAWSPDSTRIASGSLERPWEKGQSYLIHTWDAQTGAKLFTTHLRVRLENGAELFGLLWPGVVSMRWYPDSRRIALARCDNIVEIWDTTTQQMLVNRSNRTHADDAESVVWSPDGRRIAAIMDDSSVEIWNVATGSVLCSYRGHTSSVACIAWSPDSERIASLSSDGAIQVWDAATGRHHFTYCDPSQSFSALAWSPDGKRIASANRDWSIRVWRAG